MLFNAFLSGDINDNRILFMLIGTAYAGGLKFKNELKEKA